jgi:hypothetical protein
VGPSLVVAVVGLVLAGVVPSVVPLVGVVPWVLVLVLVLVLRRGRGRSLLLVRLGLLLLKAPLPPLLLRPSVVGVLPGLPGGWGVAG